MTPAVQHVLTLVEQVLACVGVICSRGVEERIFAVCVDAIDVDIALLCVIVRL